MTDFNKIAATSAATGFQYYDAQNFDETMAGQALALFSGTLHKYSTTITLAKNRPGIALTSQILTSILINFDNDQSAGQRANLGSDYSKTHTTGSSGGFPIFYTTSAYSYSDANNLNIVVTNANPSAVNAVTVPTIRIRGTAFFYLAPF